DAFARITGAGDVTVSGASVTTDGYYAVTGTTHVSSGSLILNADSLGDYTVDAGARLAFGGLGQGIANGLNGSGVIEVNGPSVTVEGIDAFTGLVDIVAGSLALAGGDGGQTEGVFNVDGRLDFSAGSYNVTATITGGGVLKVSGASAAFAGVLDFGG